MGRIRLGFVFITFVLVLLGCSRHPAFYDEGNNLLWKISDNNSSVWILGSIHYADSSFYPLSKFIEQAFQESEALAVEMDVSDTETQIKTEEEFQKEGMFSEGENLKDFLPDSLWEKLDSIAIVLGVPSEMFLPMRPWLAATVIASMAILSTGIEKDLGIDVVLLDSAANSGKEIIALETPREQVQSFSDVADSNESSGISYLETTFKEFENLKPMLKSILHAWKTADVKALQEQLKTENMTKAEEKLNQRIYNERNLKMAAKVEEFLKANKKIFVVVGVGHLILEDNVLEILSKKGYSIQKF
ncbi:MAG: TraB/GumN family protein [Fibrobacteraceae bacterium]|nr:TraB/GumN family protein [Fibrobacteraceae bacterium]